MQRFDIAIVGGGVIGWSTAWNIKQLEPECCVVVLERDQGASNCASSRGTGGVRSQFGSTINIEMSLYSLQIYERFRELVGEDLDFQQNGYAFFAQTEHNGARLRAANELQKKSGVNVSEIQAADLLKWSKHGQFQDSLYSCMGYSDGYLTGPKVRAAFQSAAIKLGVASQEGFAVSNYQGTRLTTSNGELTADVLVLAGGHDSPILAEELQLRLPIQPERHWLASFPTYTSHDANGPMLVDFDTSLHFRPYCDGILVGYDAPNDPTSASEYLNQLFEIGQTILPDLYQHAESANVWNGYYGVTPDHHAVIGRDGNVVICTGFCGHGVMHAPAAGVSAAELALYGSHRTLDIQALSHTRFESGRLLDESMRL